MGKHVREINEANPVNGKTCDLKLKPTPQMAEFNRYHVIVARDQHTGKLVKLSLDFSVPLFFVLVHSFIFWVFYI